VSDPSTSRLNLLGLPGPQLQAFVEGLGNKPFRARQLMSWMYKRGEGSFEAMTDLARDFRAQLGEMAEIRTPQIVTTRSSADGTRKWVLRADAAQAFEMVFIPEDDRGTLCISSQVGCALDCSFCSTAQQGFNRNLSTAEIVGQVWLACRELEKVGQTPYAAGQRAVTNVVLMGMGEPLANFRNVVPALRIFMDDNAFDLSRRSRPPASSRRSTSWRRRSTARSPFRCTRPTTRCATSWCRSTASTRLRSCSRPAGTTSTNRTAAASPSST